MIDLTRDDTGDMLEKFQALRPQFLISVWFLLCLILLVQLPGVLNSCAKSAVGVKECRRTAKFIAMLFTSSSVPFPALTPAGSVHGQNPGSCGKELRSESSRNWIGGTAKNAASTGGE
mmetsp:Transcript_3427/g.6965  ORF Transcript_3427/g.6965 Transcript_3427/m.6965 type:complete len:118 (+) Transcript_3427:351-704(+)